MSEPSGVVVAGAVGFSLTGLLAGLNGEAITGALFGSLIYFTTTRELPVWQRMLFFVTSFVMGYLFSPAIIEFELWGMHPFAYPGPAGFAAAAVVVSITLAAIKRRGPPTASPSGGTDG
ncbi:putative holin [Pseudomonas sp. LRF_L74]|uniref:putative holin n=1 Tax=Pseudomonas sp. LRF_L74 TaxID=3369422 RepID=UPI003F630058